MAVSSVPGAGGSRRQLPTPGKRSRASPFRLAYSSSGEQRFGERMTPTRRTATAKCLVGHPPSPVNREPSSRLSSTVGKTARRNNAFWSKIAILFHSRTNLYRLENLDESHGPSRFYRSCRGIV